MQKIIIGCVMAIFIAAMVFDTTVIEIGSSKDTRKAAFSPESYGKQEFPKIQAAVKERAVEVGIFIAALKKNRAAALKQYGVEATIGDVISIRFTGLVGEGNAGGVYSIVLPDLPDDINVKVQTGPAINGAVLRDATGTIKFGNFRNQIEYQDAGAALNNEMKNKVLSKIDTSKFTGKTITVVGSFLFLNPKSWLVTPVELSINS